MEIVLALYEKDSISVDVGNLTTRYLKVIHERSKNYQKIKLMMETEQEELTRNYKDLSNDDIKKLASNKVKIKCKDDFDINYLYDKEIEEIEKQLDILRKKRDNIK